MVRLRKGMKVRISDGQFLAFGVVVALPRKRGGNVVIKTKNRGFISAKLKDVKPVGKKSTMRDLV